MNSKYLLAILATTFLMVFFFTKDKKNKIKNTNLSDTTEYAERKTARPTVATPSLLASSDTKIQAASEPITENRQASESVQKNFSFHLKSMGKCLKLIEQNVAEKSEPTTDNLMANLRSSFGDMVVQMDDWSQTEFLDQGAVRKRVRVDYDYPDGTNPTRRLSMYQINSYGMPEIVNLTADEVNNPNEAYVSSLFEGHKIVTEEKGARAYFSDGAELIFSVRNGQLQSVSINMGDRSFNCFNLDEENSSCTCP